MKTIKVKLHKNGYGRLINFKKKYMDLSYQIDYLLDNGLLTDEQHNLLFEENSRVIRLLTKFISDRDKELLDL